MIGYYYEIRSSVRWQVWDVRTGAGLHNFSGHSGRVMTVSWHNTDHGMVISGAEDGTLHVWDPKVTIVID